MSEPTSSPTPSLLRAFVMVAWSFFGIRKGSEHRQDLTMVTPLQIVIVGVISGLLFVMLLALVVTIVSS